MRFEIRVRPGATLDVVGGTWGEDEILLVSVRARAVEGRANKAVCVALAAAFGVRRGEVVVIRGHKGRTKLVEIADGTVELPEQLKRLRAGIAS